MARIRTIKPEFWSDATISKLSIFTAFFYVALWNFADDAGRGRANAKELNGSVFSKRDDVENSQVEAALIELSDAGRILLYIDGDDRLFQICKWAEHQVINRPSRSKFPKPEGFNEPSLHIIEDSLNTHGAVTEPSHNTQCWEVGRRKTEDGTGSRKLEDGNGTTEGGSGETAALSVSEPQEVSVRPSVSLEQAPIPSVPEASPMQLVPIAPPPNRPACWQLSDADVKSLLKDGWKRDEIGWGVEIGIEDGTVPRIARSVLHAKILPDVRGGKRPERMTANAPPSPAPTTSDEEIAQIEADRKVRWKKIRANEPHREAERQKQANAAAN